jgi:hypothetical protein
MAVESNRGRPVSLRWSCAGTLLAAAAIVCLGLITNDPLRPVPLTILLALPVVVASVLCFRQRAGRCARGLATYAWVAALLCYLISLGGVWPFGAAMGTCLIVLALAARFLIPGPVAEGAEGA